PCAEQGKGAVSAAVEAGTEKLRQGKSVILYTALGPSADRGADIDRLPGARHRLGRALGTILRRLIENERLSRAVVA
ncbi:four-carbon acid sugar kinase family protein, partial [Rhizobium johnstonii]